MNYLSVVVRIKFEGRTRTVYENQPRSHQVNPCVRIQGYSSVGIPISLSDSGGNATGTLNELKSTNKLLAM